MCIAKCSILCNCFIKSGFGISDTPHMACSVFGVQWMDDNGRTQSDCHTLRGRSGAHSDAERTSRSVTFWDRPASRMSWQTHIYNALSFWLMCTESYTEIWRNQQGTQTCSR